MSSEMTVSEARAELGPVTARAAYGGETTYLTKHGQRHHEGVHLAEEPTPFVRRSRRRTA